MLISIWSWWEAGRPGARSPGTWLAAGFRVLVAEEHAGVGEPLQCSGLVSARTLEIARVSPVVVRRSLHGARVHAPGGQVLDITAGRRTP